MKVIVAEKCGFCPGVRNAISTADKVLKEHDEVYCLGPVIHNEDVVQKLSEAGLKTVYNVDEIEGGTVLIRSHGAAPSQIDELKKRGLNIVDATCVLVKRVQKIARVLEEEGYKVVVIGDANHPEIKAVVGCVSDVTVVADEKDLRKLPKNGKLGIICQTTKGPSYFAKFIESIANWGFSEMKVVNTLCRETIGRQEAAVELCKHVDVMFVLGGLESANTKRLVELCKKHNNRTFHLQNWQEFDRSVVSGQFVAGVTAGASTPEWIIDEFVKNLERVETSAK
jgi:4-hydroxy-3-methylbut-2-enyl diphosphate reductase